MISRTQFFSSLLGLICAPFVRRRAEAAPSHLVDCFVVQFSTETMCYYASVELPDKCVAVGASTLQGCLRASADQMESVEQIGHSDDWQEGYAACLADVQKGAPWTKFS